MSNDLMRLSAAEIVQVLDLKPHPEGGFFRETFRDAVLVTDGRSASTLIYFLLPAEEISAWHRVDAVEIWHFYSGAPLALSFCKGDEAPVVQHLGVDLAAGQRPQCVVPSGYWQSAKSLGAWSLVGCTVAPGFEFSGFELAPAGWQPGASQA
jgi:uncharacterized protein